MFVKIMHFGSKITRIQVSDPGHMGPFVSKSFFSENFFQDYHQKVKQNPDQARHFFCFDLGQNCLQRLSADDPRKHIGRVRQFE